MKRLIVIMLCLLTLFALTGCEDLLPSILGEDEEAPVSQTDAPDAQEQSDAGEQSEGEEDDEEMDIPVTYHAIAAEWSAAPTDGEYLAAARQRLDEYTQLLTTLSSVSGDLAKRCASAQDISGDSEYMPIYAAFVQWSKNVQGYDTSALGESALAVHEKMTALAALTDEYIGVFPSLCLSEDKSENDDYMNEILSLMVEINALV